MPAIFLLGSVAINFANIIGRYFFSISIPWAEEIMLFLMVGCVFTGCCAVGLGGPANPHGRRRQHAAGRGCATCSRCRPSSSLIATAVAVTVFAWPVITQLAAFDERSQAANFPLVIPQAMVPIGYTLMALLVAVRLLRRASGAGASTGADAARH